MDTTPERAILMMEIEVDAVDEAEVNVWYESVHFSEICAIPGVRSARRYKADENPPRYIAIYDLDHAGVVESEAFRSWREASADTARMAKRFLSIRRTVAVQIAACGKATAAPKL